MSLQFDKKLLLLGRTNVGKSTLFNVLTKRRKAMMMDVEGVTRDFLQDRLYGAKDWLVFDTPGWDPADYFFSVISKPYQMMLQSADAVAVVLDGLAGVTKNDYDLVDHLRDKNIDFFFIVNKVDSPETPISPEVLMLIGSQRFFATSALQRRGLEEVMDCVEPSNSYSDRHTRRLAYDQIPHIVFAGRPNVGKSTLFNCLLGEDVVAVSDRPGTTRDTVWRHYKYHKKDEFYIFDTAGLRKKIRNADALEKMSIEATQGALRFAHVVCLLMDAIDPLNRQDLRVLHHLCLNGRAIVIVVNKIDLVRQRDHLLRSIKQFFQKHFTDLLDPIVIPISAKNATGTKRLIPTVQRVYKDWNIRVTTSQLNKAVLGWVHDNPPPRGKSGRPIKIRYVAQINQRPPTFFIASNNAQDLPQSYIRFLRHKIQREFNLTHVPVRMVVRSTRQKSSS